MTRAAPALALAAVAGCAAIPASTPWTVQGAGPVDCSPGEIASESCYPQELLTAPVVVGPGRVQVVTRAGLSGKGAWKPSSPIREQFRFFVDEIVRRGHQPVASGICPGRPFLSQVTSLIRMPSGESAVLCLEPGYAEGCHESRTPGCFDDAAPGPCIITHCNVTFAHFGVVDRARQTIDWRWRDTLAHDLDIDTVSVAAFGERVAILYRRTFDPARSPNGWIVDIAPKGKGIEVSADMEEESLAAFLVADGNLHLLLWRSEWRHQYRQLTIAPDGRTWSRGLDQAGRLTAGPLAGECLAEGTDRSVTVSLPYWAEGETSPKTPSRMLTLRYSNALVPQGPDVFPSTRAACAPRIGSDGARWVRATFDDQGPLIVYEIAEREDRSGGLHVLRGAR